MARRNFSASACVISDWNFRERGQSRIFAGILF
jgi:hypothetical protein